MIQDVLNLGAIASNASRKSRGVFTGNTPEIPLSDLENRPGAGYRAYKIISRGQNNFFIRRTHHSTAISPIFGTTPNSSPAPTANQHENCCLSTRPFTDPDKTLEMANTDKEFRATLVLNLNLKSEISPGGRGSATRFFTAVCEKTQGIFFKSSDPVRTRLTLSKIVGLAGA